MLAVPMGAQTPSGQQSAISDSSLLEQLDRAMAEVTERAMRAVVEIDVSGYGKAEDSGDNNNDNSNMITRQRSLGSGVIVDPSGYIMTNNHVVAGAERITVVLSPAINEMSMGRTNLRQPRLTFPAKLIGTSRQADLALIKIDASNLPTLPLAEQFTVHLGQMVVAIGAPEGLDHTVTRGIVSAVGRQPDPEQPMVYIQTDAPINHGNSGGPLVDRDGNLVGINTFIYSEGGGSEGLGFAIPQPIVRFVYEELRDHGHVRRSTIGADPQSITAPLAAGLKLPQDWGVIIADVQPGGPADTAGLKRRDIVQAIDGRPIDSLPKYAALIYLHKRGEPMQMEVLRGEKMMMLNITPQPLNTGIESLEDLVRPEESLVGPLGIFVVPLSAEVRQLMGGVRSEGGVVVAGILDNEPQVYADLAEGDIIRSINQKAVSQAGDLRSTISGLKPGDPAVLEVERNGALRWVAFEME